MTDLRTAAQQALEALEHLAGFACDHSRGMCVCEYRDAADAIRAALAQAEPVQSAAWVDAYDMIDRFLRNNLRDDDYAEYSAALDSLYTAPQQAEPVQHDESIPSLAQRLRAKGYPAEDAGVAIENIKEAK